ncbi:MAG: hypothetical protein ACREQV_13550 [Candidatus Binatia bacterium]
MHEHHVADVVANWKEQPRKIAQKLIKQYGVPDEVTSDRLIWHNNGPWKRTELINEEIPHKFPEPHYDSLLQVIPYRVPPQASSELLKFDGSIVVERTRGELAARCDDETANYLALNLAHEIMNGNKSIDQARRFYAETVQQKKHQDYMKKFLFSVPTTDQADPDLPVRTE